MQLRRGTHAMTSAGRNNLKEVRVASLSLEPMRELLDREATVQLHRDIERTHQLLAGRVIWNINSTAVGGGVAEMLQSLLVV